MTESVEWERLAELTRLPDVEKQLAETSADGAQWQSRAETAERELAELRERIGEMREEWAYDAPGFFFGPPLLDETNARRLVGEVNVRGGHAVLKHRIVGEWKAADGGR